MDTRPEPPPEGRLIDAARVRAGVSVREAARRAGISNTRWNQIVKGSHAPGRTIARMARAAGMTAAELEAAGRPDAAGELAARLAEEDAAPPASPSPAADETAQRIITTISGIAEGIGREIDRKRAAGHPEDRMFDDPYEQAMWAMPLMSETERILRVAWLRVTPRGSTADPPAELAG